ncbi:hypothetical protein Bca4012_089375 [Brassica carinata]
MTVDRHNEPSDDAQRVAELQKQCRKAQSVAVGEYGPPGSKPSPQHGMQQEASFQHPGSTYGESKQS